MDVCKVGKGERSQRTDLEKFWPTIDFAQPDLDGQLASWLRFYNHERPHDSLQDQTPVERMAELQHRIHSASDVAAAYDPSRENFRTRHDLFDHAIRELKASRCFTQQRTTSKPFPRGLHRHFDAT